jgi:adenosylcobyric acid synthase
MVQGVSSWAGKSLLVTALARSFSRRGLRVAPFKAQNMSNNARVVDGGEIGVAQYLQALAAGIEPDVRMNPILVKPEADDRSQVVVLGRFDEELSRRPWLRRPEALWPVAAGALAELLGEYDLVLLEGAGSPAETNLRAADLANMRSAHEADAAVLLVADIDRGGAFAHLFGTWALLPERDRHRLRGFVLNKFRGDERLLGTAPPELAERTGMAYVGLLPFLRHGLPDEDGAALPERREGAPRVAVVGYPTASNLDELKALEQVADVVPARSAGDLDGAALVVLPGSKHVAADLGWLRRTGLASAVAAAAARGTRVLGICGGLQMLGSELVDEGGVDGSAVGLGLLPLRTVFRREKRTRTVDAVFTPPPGAWSALAGLRFRGYEIRHGETTRLDDVAVALSGDRGFAAGSVLGIAVHGALEQPEVVRALLGAAPATGLDAVFDELADAVEERLDLELLDRFAGARLLRAG